MINIACDTIWKCKIRKATSFKTIAKNIPIISSDCPTGPREILLRGKLGDLFKVGDYKKLYNLIKDFNQDKNKLLKKSKKAKKYLIRFDLETNCKKYEKIISSFI